MFKFTLLKKANIKFTLPQSVFDIPQLLLILPKSKSSNNVQQGEQDGFI